MPTIRIPLHSRKHPGLFAVIDEEDYELVSEYRWNVQPGRNTFYAVTSIRLRGMEKPVQIKMHRMILDPHQGLVVDHIDGNGLNNTRDNLRQVSHADNLDADNVHSPEKRRGTMLGVHYQKSRGKWTAHYKGQYIGIFSTEVAAAEAYDRVRYQDTGDVRRLNFPGKVSREVETVEALSKGGFDK